MPYKSTCYTCGNALCRDRRPTGRTFCNFACMGLSIRKVRVPLACSQCGTQFDVLPFRLGIPGRTKYCSVQCRNLAARRARPTPEFNDEGLIARIPLYGADGAIRAYALVDAADAEWVSQWRWNFSDGYATSIEIQNGKRLYLRMHRLILGLKHGEPFDGEHKNRIRTDCRRSNLRIVPKGANAQNVPSNRDSTSIYRGVSWSKAVSKWQANVQSNGKIYYLGVFSDEMEAAEVARAARARLLPYATD